MSSPVPLQISFHGLEASPALSDRVAGEVEKLAQYFDRITFCRVVVDRPNHRHRHGDRYAVRVEIGVPRQLLVVRQEPDQKHLEHEDPYVAVRDAFLAARRQLEEYARKLRGG
jgi:ribosome-associated translation inhibitor RaiA